MSNHFNIKIGNKADFKGYCYTGGICDTNGYAFETAEGWILIDAPEGFGARIHASDRRIVDDCHQKFA